MYLKRLELQGFKSFPDKIRLDFKKGITAVVGPNGSGKSNVSDSIRWVLGEMSAKSLRGAKMEDIIFAGTQNRKPLGFAQVSMTIDNSDRKMNIDYSEITITRRVYRSGESQFLINNTACRLKDVHEIFMDTGIGREGYSIIGQGRIDEILSVKSEDRRLLFEEAAGIVKYKNRKNEAEGKLEKERQNLMRVNDIIMELGVQVEPLLEQSNKAKSFIDYSERLKIVEINIFIDKVSTYENDLKEIDENISQTNEIIDTENISLEKDKKEIETLKNKIQISEEKSETLQIEISQSKTEIEQTNSEISLQKQKIEHLETDCQRIEKDILVRMEQFENSQKQQKDYEVAINELSEKELVEKEKIFSLKENLLEISNILKIQEDEIAEYSSGHIEKLHAISESEGNISKAQANYEMLEEKTEQLNETKDEVSEKIDAIKISIQSNENEIAQKELLEKKYNSDNEFLLKDKEKLKAELTAQKEEHEKNVRTLRDKTSRCKLLSDLEESYEGYYKSVKTILKQKRDNPEKFSGVCGAVAELIDTPQKYETAIEIALGGSLQNIVTKTDNDAKNVIEYLKANKEGRATFLPITAIKGKNLGNIKAQILTENGVIGIAVDLVNFDKDYENIFSSLLGKVIVVDNIANGLVLSKKYSYQYKIVTLEGDVLNSGGSMTGGSVSRGQSNILSRNREILGLTDDIKRIQELCVKSENAIKDMTLKYQAVSEKIQSNISILRNFEIEKISINANLKQEIQTLQSLNENLLSIKNEEEKIMQSLIDTNKEIRLRKENHVKIEEDIKEIKLNLEKKQELTKESKSSIDNLTKSLNELEISVSVITQNKNSTYENMERVKKELDSFLEDIENYKNNILQIKYNIESSTNLIIELDLKISEISNNQIKIISELEVLTLAKSEMKSFVTDLEKSIQISFERISSLNNTLTRFETKKENLVENSRKLYDEMWNQYNITIQDALQSEKLELSRSELEVENAELKKNIKNLGLVNLGAIEEYKLVKERFEFLSKQKQDIIDAEEKLLAIIADLKGLMENKFYEQFRLISENFSIVFAEMFGGGTAYLKLSDKDNVLESGIEIISQPPGKNLQNMMLFSGGERALTAIALLFAILRLKPSPFCILDEIEAALDDANVKRYASYLKNFSHDTQFIIITHRKGTMEAADLLYGVTMQEQGVSKLVSVSFVENSLS